MDADGRTDDESNGDRSTVGLDRRSVLRAVGGTGLALGLAGCSTSSRRTYEAEPVALDSDGEAQGYELRDRGTAETEREVEADDGTDEETVDVTIVSHVASYGRDGEGFVEDAMTGLVSTPVVEDFGGGLNPLADESMAALLATEAGRPFLEQLDIEPDWSRRPEPVRAASGRLFERDVEFRVVAGVTGDGVFALLNVVRVEEGEDVVVVGDARREPAGGGGGPWVGEDGYVDEATLDRCIAAFADLLPTVVHGADAEETQQTARIGMEEVPEEVRQRGQLVIDRFSGDHPELWSSRAALGETAYRVSRPDVDDVAYYELAVEPEGYVVCATDRHDHPVPNFGTEGRPIGRALEAEADEPVAKVVWIDRQRFVAENADGELVVARGNTVYRLEGLEELLEYDEPVGVVAGPDGDGPSPDGEVTRGYEPIFEYREDAALPADAPLPDLYGEDADEPTAGDVHESLPYVRWGSHEELLTNYEESFGPLLDALRERAADAWDALEAAEAEEAAQARANPGDAEGDGPAGAAGAAVDVSSVFDGLDQETPEGEKYWAAGWHEQVYYFQFVYGDCIVGCGPVAWAILFGWADRQAEGGPYEDTWWPRWGLYREDGGYGEGEGVPAPTAENVNRYDGDQLPSGSVNVVEELNEHMLTWCDPTADDDDEPGEIQSATHPVQMPLAAQYFAGRTGTALAVDMNVTGLPTTGPKELAVDSIRGDIDGMGPTPAIVGTGWLSHYPIAYAFSDGGLFGTDHFKVNNGWGNHHPEKAEWVWAPTWFAGAIHPNWD